MANTAGTSDVPAAACGPARRSGELLFLGRPGERGNGGASRLHGLRDLVEVAGADLALVLGGSVPLRFGGELGLLQPDVGRHVLGGVAAGEVEHAVVERVEAGEGDEL